MKLLFTPTPLHAAWIAAAAATKYFLFDMVERLVEALRHRAQHNQRRHRAPQHRHGNATWWKEKNAPWL